MFERKMAVEQPVKAKINVQVRIKICKCVGFLANYLLY